MAKYSKGAQKSVKQAMHKKKRGKLKSGKTVKSRQQAIAIGLSEARKKGAKVPPPKKGGKKKARKKASKKKNPARKKASAKRSKAGKEKKRKLPRQEDNSKVDTLAC